jgi:uncharacterized protein
VGPLALRELVGAFLSGQLNRDGLRRDIAQAVRQLGTQSGRAVALVRAIAFELDDEGKRTGGTAPGRVVTGLCHELFQALPNSDTNPAREEVLAILDRHGKSVARQHGLEIVGLAGSVARNTATAFSDVDLAVRWIKKPVGWDQYGAIEDCRRKLSDVLGRPVDVVVLDDLRPHVRESFMRDLIAPVDAAHAA